MTENNDKLISHKETEMTKPDDRITVYKGEIEIKANGKPVSFEISQSGFVYLAIDCSLSMADADKMHQAQKGSFNFIKDALRKGYLVGLIAFDSFAVHVCTPQKNISELENYISKINTELIALSLVKNQITRKLRDKKYPFGNRLIFMNENRLIAAGVEEAGTDIADVIFLATKKMEAKKITGVIVIVTDGQPNRYDDPEATLKAADIAKSKGIEIIAIGTDDADQDLLKKIASRKDLGQKVATTEFGKAIASTAKMLPDVTNKMLSND